jgi:hypothetical protein
MRSPYIVIPEFGTLHRGGNVLVVDFGKLKVESELQPKNQNLEVRKLSMIKMNSSSSATVAYYMIAAVHIDNVTPSEDGTQRVRVACMQILIGFTINLE